MLSLRFSPKNTNPPYKSLEDSFALFNFILSGIIIILFLNVHMGP